VTEATRVRVACLTQYGGWDSNPRPLNHESYTPLLLRRVQCTVPAPTV